MEIHSPAETSSSDDILFSQKIRKGVLWVISASIIARILSFFSAIILARLLSPADFGLMAVASAIISFLNGTTFPSFESALIQKQDKPEEFLDTAWTFELFRYLTLSIIIMSMVPFLSHFFNEPRAANILIILCISLPIGGLRNIGVIFFRKNIEFHKQFVFETVPIIVNIAVVIPLAFLFRNVWALVWATICTTLCTCIISYLMHPYRPRISFDIKKARELFRFSKWILGSGIVAMIQNQGITMFLGKFLGMSMLGYYNRANTFSTEIFRQVYETAWKVGYPAYSNLQNNADKFNKAYLKTLQILTFIGFPMAGGLFILSHDFVDLFLTNKWLPIIPLIQIFCLNAMLSYINTPAEIAFQAKGNPGLLTKISTIGVFILVLLIYPLSSAYGISGAAIAMLLGVLIPTPIVHYYALNLTQISIKDLILPIIYPLLNTVIMCLSICLIRIFLGNIDIVSFFYVIAFGILIYFLNSYILFKFFHYDILRK